MVGPKLSLSVEWSLSLSLSQNFACHNEFRVCVRKPPSRPRAGAYFMVGFGRRSTTNLTPGRLPLANSMPVAFRALSGWTVLCSHRSHKLWICAGPAPLASRSCVAWG